MPLWRILAWLAGVSAAWLPRPACAGLAGTQQLVQVPGALQSMHPPGDTDRLFVVARAGTIRILDKTSNSLLASPFLDVTSSTDTTGEGGLLGMAFHPEFTSNGKFYVYLTTNDNGGFDSEVREYVVSAGNPNEADPTPRTILRIAQPQFNHNAGWIGFSPVDGYLYVPTGDGGGGYDSGSGHTSGVGNAQDLTDNLLGKVLRIDVDGDDFPADSVRNYAIPADNPFVGATGDDEIFDYGLRNPFRANFDRATGDLWIGDVGQAVTEEINLHPADVAGGVNFGWREMEGSQATYRPEDPPVVVGSIIPTARLPEYEYLQPEINGDNEFAGRIAIGGVVYRGPDPTLRGQYIFGDGNTQRYWMFDPADPHGTVQTIRDDLTPDVGSLGAPLSISEDPLGNLYITTSAGAIYRVLTDALTPGDFDADGDVDEVDLADWESGFATPIGAATADGDANGDGAVTGADFLLWQRNHGDSSLNVPTTTPSTVVPEPPTYALIAIAAACLYACLRQIVGSLGQRGRSTEMIRRH